MEVKLPIVFKENKEQVLSGVKGFMQCQKLPFAKSKQYSIQIKVGHVP